MTREEAKHFLSQNREALILLAKKAKDLDSLNFKLGDAFETAIEVRGRVYAKQIVEEWISELWGINNEDLNKLEEEPDLYSIYEREGKEKM